MFNVTRKSNELFTALKEELSTISSQSHFDYNGLVRQYNELEPEELVDFPYEKKKQSGLVAQLLKRGLQRDVDYTLVMTEVESEKKGEKDVETAFITRVSTKQGAMYQSKRGRRAMTEEERAAKPKPKAPPKEKKAPTAKKKPISKKK